MLPSPTVRSGASDLIRRVLNALDVAFRMVRTVLDTLPAELGTADRADGTPGFLREKVVAETAMLLYCVEPVRGADERIRVRSDVIAKLLIPHARHDDVLAAICMDPGRASDHAVAHLILSRLGYPDAGVDELLTSSLAMGIKFGPERLPHRRLEQAWLARMWNVFPARAGADSRSVAESMLGGPVDALGATRLDIYAFTHAVMYASYFGRRAIPGSRSQSAIAADAIASLAHCLDTSDLDLTAEVVMIWPMLGIAWSPAATFAFGILCAIEDDLGFLPGSTFDAGRYQSLSIEGRSQFALLTSYHTAYVMGFLCAIALRQDRAPPAEVPSARRAAGAAAEILRLLDLDNPAPCWRAPIAALSARQQDSVAQLLLAIVLRRARARGDIQKVMAALEVALAFDLVGGVAPTQAVALLRRSHALKPSPL